MLLGSIFAEARRRQRLPGYGESIPGGCSARNEEENPDFFSVFWNTEHGSAAGGSMQWPKLCVPAQLPAAGHGTDWVDGRWGCSTVDGEFIFEGAALCVCHNPKC